MSFFKRLSIQEWQQFRSLDIEFHPRLTVLTGANASGKTTILNLLARHVDWQVPALAVPHQSLISGAIEFFTRFFAGKDRSNETQIGKIVYGDGREARLTVPNSKSAAYNVSIENQQGVACFFVPSHRSVFRYQGVSQIPVARMDKNHAFTRVWNSTRNRYFGGGDAPTSFHIKETLIAWSIFGRGNVDMAPDAELMGFYEGFQETLRQLLPPSLGFRKFSIRQLEIVLECDSGEFMIDGASGGLSTLIDLAWQIFMYSSSDRGEFTVLIDEAENHLHPTMQRRILSDLLRAFPQIRFIVSTHSPLIVNSVRDSTVYALRYDKKAIVSERLDLLNKAKTASQILDEVLGVSFTMPMWAEQEFNSIIRNFSEGELDETKFAQIRRSLADMGLEHYMPQTLDKVLGEREKK